MYNIYHISSAVQWELDIRYEICINKNHILTKKYDGIISALRANLPSKFIFQNLLEFLSHEQIDDEVG